MYYTDKPENIIATNSMFILNEHFDGKTTQIGGTIPFSDYFSDKFHDGRYNTYLYLKTFEKDSEGKFNGKNKYVKIVIKPHRKIVLLPLKSTMTVIKKKEI
ncbi:hypothetical protein RHO13_01610 [Orbus wheelerorum]|uniref:hypothetical protein n=1 Tax=Orbus wheelerorum TaxID=3074111 RepID=UPI00370D3A20